MNGTSMPVKRVVPVLALSAACVLNAGETIRAQDSPRRADVQLLPTVRATWSCAGDSEVFTHFIEISLHAKNTSPRPVVVPVLNSLASRVLISQSLAAMRAGRHESDFRPTVIKAGPRRAVRRDDFVVVVPGALRELPFTVRIVVPATMEGARMPGLATPGHRWLAFDWYAWPLSTRAASRWSDEFHKEGELLIGHFRSEPIEITIPTQPKFTDCPAVE